MRSWRLRVFVLGLLVLAGFGVAAAYLQAQLFVRNPRPSRARITKSPADYGLRYESLTLQTEDHYNLAAWYIPAQNRAAVIVAHGYKGTREAMLSRAAMLARHGYGVLLLDLRAHGESEGDTISFGLYEVRDVEAAYEYLLQRPEVDRERIGALGASLGGGLVLLAAAANPGLKAVVSESAFVSLDDEVPTAVSGTGLPPILIAPLVEWFAEREVGFKAEQVSPIAHIAEISPRPVLLLQGGKDHVVPFDSGQRLYDAAKEPRELWFDPEVGHCGFGLDRAPEFEARVTAFFDRYLLEKTAASAYLFQ